MRLATTFFLLFTLVPASAFAEDYAALFDDAVRNVSWRYPADWAYTETRRTKDLVEVGRYDPSRPEGRRWELVSVNGRMPSDEEAGDYLENKRGDRGFMGGDGEADDDNDPSDLVQPGSLELLDETGSFWLLSFVPTSGDDDEKFMRKMAGTVRIAKAGRYLEYLDISSRKPVRPALGVKIRDFHTRFEFAPAADGEVVVPVGFRFRVKGRAFLAIGFDEMETVEFSEFEPVSD